MNTNVDTKAAESTASALTVTPGTDAFRDRVLPAESRAALFNSLPTHIKPEVFERNLVNALMMNPDLQNFAPALVFREVSKAAGLGLLLDPQLGEAYMVTAYNYKSKKTEPQLRVGYRGMCKLARQSGNVTAIYAHEVCEDDRVECDLGVPKTLHHRPKLFGDRGPVIGYFAVITYKDGTFDFEPMSVTQTRAIRDRSDAWKAFSEGKIKSTPWSTDEDEMAKKTTLRRLMKRQDLSPEMRTAIEIEDRAEFPEMRQVRAVIDDGDGPPPPPPPPQVTQQSAPLAPAMDDPPPPGSEDDSYLRLVSEGRDDGQQQIWGGESGDEPPTPSRQPGQSRPNPAASTGASPAASTTSTHPAAGEVFLTKAQLLAAIEQGFATFKDSEDWIEEVGKDIGELSGPDQREVEKAFNAKTAKLKK